MPTPIPSQASDYPLSDTFINFSGMYDDKLLTKFLPRMRDTLYSEYLRLQSTLLNETEYSWDASDWEIIPALANSIKYPAGTHFHKLDNFELPISNKKKYLSKFGNFQKPISLMDINKCPDIFSHTYKFSFGDFTLNDIIFVQDRLHNYYVVIQNHATAGLSQDVFQKLVARGGKCFLWKDMFAVSYWANGPISSFVLAGTTEDRKILRIAKSTKTSNIPAQTANNSWDVYMTANSALYGGNVSYKSHCTLSRQDATYMYFDVSTKFISAIQANNATIEVHVTDCPNRRSMKFYQAQNSSEGGTPTLPIISIAADGNPVPFTNLKLYGYSSTDDIVKCRYGITEKNLVQFPAIYDFSDLSIISDLMIEIVDFTDKQLTATFNNHMQEVIDLMGDDLYRYCVVNDLIHDMHDFGIAPDTRVDHNDFMHSIHYPDLRRYLYSKFVQILDADPYFAKDYYKFMNSLNRRIITKCGTPKEMKFNSGLTQHPQLSGTNQIVTDTSFLEKRKGMNDPKYFNTPHSYIKVHSENHDAYAEVYLGGAMITPTYVDNYLEDIYLFFPVNQIAEMLTKIYEPNNEVGIFIVDLYPNSYRGTSHDVITTMKFSSASDRKVLLEGIDDTFTMDNLTFFNVDSGDIYPLSYFSFSRQIAQTTISLDDTPIAVITGKTEEIEYMLTANKELYLTQDKQDIILSTEKIEVSPSFTEPNSSDPTSPDPASWNEISSKNFTPGEIIIGLKNQNLVGSNIACAFVKSTRDYWFTGEDLVVNDEGGFTISIDDVLLSGELDPQVSSSTTFQKGSPLYNKIELFFNGTKIQAGDFDVKFHNKNNIHTPVTITIAPLAIDTFKAAYPDLSEAEKMKELQVCVKIRSDRTRYLLHVPHYPSDDNIGWTAYPLINTTTLTPSSLNDIFVVGPGQDYQIYLSNRMVDCAPFDDETTRVYNGYGVRRSYTNEISLSGLTIYSLFENAAFDTYVSYLYGIPMTVDMIETTYGNYYLPPTELIDLKCDSFPKSQRILPTDSIIYDTRHDRK